MFYRDGLDRDLEAPEVDANFREVVAANDETRALVVAPNGIADFTITNNNEMRLILDNGDVKGPQIVPIASTNWREDGWVPFTDYAALDLFTINGLVVMVRLAHTSGATFDINANDGSGHNFYALWYAVPGSSLPVGGATDWVLSKIDGADFNVTWRKAGVPSDGDPGMVLTRFGSSYEWRSPLITSIVKTQSGDYGPVLGDTGAYIRFTNSGDATVTVPANADVAFDVGTEITLREAGSGGVIIASDPAVTINVPDGFQSQLLGSHATATLKKVDTDEWDLYGSLLPV